MNTLIQRVMRKIFSGSWLPRFGMVATVFLLSIAAMAADSVPVLHLPFDGAMAPAAGNGAAEPHNGPTFVEGKFGQAVWLAGQAHLTVPAPACIRQGEFTISFWIKPLWEVNDGLSHPILDIPNDPAKRDSVGDGPNRLFVGKGFGEVIAPDYLWGVINGTVASKQLRRGEWTHVAIAYSVGQQLRSDYFNGRGEKREWKSGPLDGHGGTIWLGSRDDGQGGGDFVLDDFKLYDRMLKEEELPTAAGASFPPPPAEEDVLTLQRVDPARAVETPHVAWARPLAGGPLRALCIAEHQKTREFVELAQRAEIDIEVVGLPNLLPNLMTNRDQVEKRGLPIEQALRERRPDVVILAAYPWDLLAESTRSAILAYVEAGGGLLLVTPWCAGDGVKMNVGGGFHAGWAETTEGRKLEARVAPVEGADARQLLDGIPWRHLPMFAPQLGRREPAALFRAGRVGQGRLLIYDLYQRTTASTYQCLTPDISYAMTGDTETGFTSVLFDAFDYDYAVGAAARAALWAAGRETKAELRQIVFESAVVEPRLTPGQRGQWRIEAFNAGAADLKAEIRLTLRGRGPDAPTELRQSVELKPGRNGVAFGHTLDRVGPTFADVRLLLDGKVADWGSGCLDVLPGNPYLGQVKADRDLYAAGQAPRLEATFSFTKYAFRAGELGELRWRLYDGFGRMVERGVKEVIFDPQDGVLTADTFALAPLPDGCLGYELVVELARAGAVSDQRLLLLRRAGEPWSDFRFTLWGGYGDPVVSLATQVMRDRYQASCAMANLNKGRPNYRDLAATLDWHNLNNLYTWAYIDIIGHGGQVADAAQARRLAERSAAAAEVGVSRNVYFYGLGDEVGTGNPFRPPTGFEQEDFRLQMQARYKTIAALNEAWNASFVKWDEIALPDTQPTTADPKQVPGVAVKDYREELFARCIGFGTEAIRRVDADAKVGVEGMAGLSQAYPAGNLASLAKHATFLGPYGWGMEQDMIRGLRKPGDLLGGWYNYEFLNPDYSRSGPWTFLLAGADTFQWFATIDSQGWYSALNPDFSAFKQFAWTYEELEPILSGIGKLCKTSERGFPGVAILYDHRNLDRVRPGLQATMHAYLLLKDVGLWPDFIGGEQIRAGELERRGVKALWLPYAWNLDQDVAAGIRAFVERGGLVIADTVPGVSNGFKRYDNPLLADLFVESGTIKSTMPPVTDEAVAAWSDRVRPVGQGHTLFFNLPESGRMTYRRDRFQPRGAGLRQAVAAFLGAQGLQAPVRAGAADGGWEPLDVAVWQHGASRFAAFKREIGAVLPNPEPRAFEIINAAGKAHVYESRAGKYLGEADRARLTVERARGGMVAFLPYKAETIQIDGLPPVCRLGERVELRLQLRVTDGSLPEGGVFRIECFDPLGRKVVPLSGKHAWGLGGVTVPLAIAHNDPAGDWKVTVTDVATGIQVEKNVTIQPEK